MADRGRLGTSVSRALCGGVGRVSVNTLAILLGWTGGEDCREALADCACESDRDCGSEERGISCRRCGSS